MLRLIKLSLAFITSAVLSVLFLTMPNQSLFYAEAPLSSTYESSEIAVTTTMSDTQDLDNDALIEEQPNSQPVTINYVDTSGKTIQSPTVTSGVIGDYFMVAIPLIKGYLFDTTYDSTIGVYSDIRQTITLIYKKVTPTPPQGNYITYGKYVTVTQSNYNTWRNFNWKKKYSPINVTGRTLLAKGKYHHRNGSTYLSLYDKNGQWYGYINQRATKVGNGPQGAYIKDGRKIKINKKGYTVWKNFKWTPFNNTTKIINKQYIARGRYRHFNGSTYYSLYDAKGKWHGYLNAKATQ